MQLVEQVLRPRRPPWLGADRKRCNRTLPSASGKPRSSSTASNRSARKALQALATSPHPRHNRALLQRGAQAGGDACIVFNHQDSHGRIVTRKPQQVRFASIKTGLSATFNVAGMQQSLLSGAQPQSISQRHTLVVTLLLLAAVVAWDAGGQDLAWANAFGTPQASLCASTGFVQVMHEARRIGWLVVLALALSVWWPLGILSPPGRQ